MAPTYRNPWARNISGATGIQPQVVAPGTAANPTLDTRYRFNSPNASPQPPQPTNRPPGTQGYPTPGVQTPQPSGSSAPGRPGDRRSNGGRIEYWNGTAWAATPAQVHRDRVGTPIPGAQPPQTGAAPQYGPAGAGFTQPPGAPRSYTEVDAFRKPPAAPAEPFSAQISSAIQQMPQFGGGGETDPYEAWKAGGRQGPRPAGY
jgi:hypothetical protein